jgi:hypothetical protein
MTWNSLKLPNRPVGLLVALAFVWGCGSRDGGEAEAGADETVVPASAGTVPGQNGETAAQAQQRAVSALSVILPDAKSARYAEVRPGTAGAVCGLVDAKQGDGKYSGPRPFVVSPEGVAVVSTTPQVNFGDAEDLFPDFYIRWCATPAELRLIGPRIALPEASPPPAADELPELLESEIAAAPPAGGPAEPPLPEAAAAQPKASAPSAPPGEDSFSSAVLRERKDGAPGK